jgi:hypothetical protein
MMSMKKLYLAVILIAQTGFVAAQQELSMPAIPAMRQLHHEYIEGSLRKIDKLSSIVDSIFPVTNDPATNSKINRSIRVAVHNMRARVESNTQLSENDKYNWLRGINDMLTSFQSAWRAGLIRNIMYPSLVHAFDEAMELDIKGKSMIPVIDQNELEIGNVLVQNYCLKDNIGVAEARDILVYKACQRDQASILKVLSKQPSNRFADTLIMMAARNNQEELYNYAAAPNELGKRIQQVNDPLVKLIAELARNKNGRMFFPFLDELYRGKLTIGEITPILDDEKSDRYYKLLVKTRIGYAERMWKGDTPMAAKTLAAKLKSKAIELYINEINALHDESSEQVRFRKIDSLNPQELYYLAVLGEEEIYTSSFVVGVYPRIFARMKKPDSDSLLSSLHYDYYRKFIKMSAAYNTLDDFLKRTSKASAEKLMRSFVNGLDRSNSLEDAVDVADSYASIYNKEIRSLVLGQVQENLKNSRAQHNKRGTVIYNLLNTIFVSADSSGNTNLSASLGINTVYTMPLNELKNAEGRVIIQQYSYGDKDAANYFGAFLSRFNNSNWRTIKKPFWVEIVSQKGTPITIYANLPLDETKDLDAMAQDSLNAYLETNGLMPSMVIHRGHSYYVQQTIEQLAPSAKVVLLGSCGGYQKLNEILDICPSAHIISSKQVAAGVLNQALIDVITDQIRQNKDLVWADIWKNLQSRVTGNYKEKFEDYIPPHRNLGAIFIMAYNKAMMSNAE